MLNEQVLPFARSSFLLHLACMNPPIGSDDSAYARYSLVRIQGIVFVSRAQGPHSAQIRKTKSLPRETRPRAMHGSLTSHDHAVRRLHRPGRATPWELLPWNACRKRDAVGVSEAAAGGPHAAEPLLLATQRGRRGTDMTMLLRTREIEVVFSGLTDKTWTMEQQKKILGGRGVSKFTERTWACTSTITYIRAVHSCTQTRVFTAACCRSARGRRFDMAVGLCLGVECARRRSCVRASTVRVPRACACTARTTGVGPD